MRLSYLFGLNFQSILLVCTFGALLVESKINVTSMEYNEIESTFPTRCHVCKFLVDEIYIFLKKTWSHDVVQLGSVFQRSERKVKYENSELRLTEALEEACQKMLEYNVHKDRPIRYARKMSETFSTLHGLRKRGVKVDLGFPVEMWDDPDREVQVMKQKCEQLVEDYEAELTNWFYHHRGQNLTKWLCAEKVLKGYDQDCLDVDFADQFKDSQKRNKEKKKENKVKRRKKKSRKEGRDNLAYRHVETKRNSGKAVFREPETTINHSEL